MSKPNSFKLQRRGFDLGAINIAAQTQAQQPWPSDAALHRAWRNGQAIPLPKIVSASTLSAHAPAIHNSKRLYERVLAGDSAEVVFDEPAYAERWQAKFEALGSSVNPAVRQEIETLFYDGKVFDGERQGQELVEDLWVKLSWLSYFEGDTSLRFRFSFGVDHEEDVASDPIRQRYSANLAEALFPESVLISENQILLDLIQGALGDSRPRFVERIVYFNAPSGGAYLHHDLERGHAGVIYVQASGQTCWLAISKFKLMQVIAEFVESCDAKNGWPKSLNKEQQAELLNLANYRSALDAALESFNHDALIHLINETQDFVQYLIELGYAHVLNAGDGILLPQQTEFDGTDNAEQNCCWHSVFCLNDESGEGLSFAINVN